MELLAISLLKGLLWKTVFLELNEASESPGGLVNPPIAGQDPEYSIQYV